MALDTPDPKPVPKPARSASDRAMRWAYGIAALGLTAVGLDLYAHEDKRQDYCSKLQKDFEAAFANGTLQGDSIFSTRDGLERGKIVDVPQNAVGYFFPFLHQEKCYLSVKYDQ